MENIKYILFYALLVGVIATGVMNYHWIVIFLAGFLLAIGFILVKGKDWRKIMGRSDLNGAVVFIGACISQTVLAAVLYGIGRLIAYFL